MIPAIKRARDRRVLSEFVAGGDAPLGELANRGHDLQRLIAAEASVEVVGEALRRTRRAGDMRWSLELGRRLWDLQPDAETGVAYVRDLTAAGHGRSAEQMLAKLDAAAVGVRDHAELSFGLALLNNDFASARACLDRAFGSVDAVPAHHRARFIEGLLGAGHFDLVDAEVRAARERHPGDARLGALAVRATLALDGPTAAAVVLDAALPSGSTPALVLRNELLLFRGRYREALERVTDAISQSPQTWEFYSQAEMAALHCDRIDDYAALLEGSGSTSAGRLQIAVMRCRLAADRNDFPAAERLLPDVRAMSDWSWQTARLHLACQRGDAKDIDAVYRSCVEAGIRSGGPEIALAQFYYFYRGTADNTRKALALLTPHASRAADNVHFLQGMFRHQLASDQEEACRSHFLSLPDGLKGSAVLAPFGCFFDARDGRHEAASGGWRRYVAEAAPEAVNAVASYPETIELRYEERPGAVLLFLTVFNGIEFLDWFLGHYRRLGVDHFFVVDNGSDDGTFERLLAEPDVSLFRDTGSFARSACGVFWMNHLMHRFGIGHWCFHVDMDEAFVFPGDDRKDLATFLAYLDEHGFGSVPAFMLDIYPERLEPAAGDPFERSRYVDRDYTSMLSEVPPYAFVQGGLRSRVTGRSLMMTKAPLARMSPDIWYLANNHQHTHAPMADVSAALLHYKFIGDLSGRLDEAIDRGEHFMGARFYKALKTSLTNPDGGTLLSEHSVEYEGSAQLVDLGLLQTCSRWEVYSPNRR